jgi:hypothetical protein
VLSTILGHSDSTAGEFNGAIRCAHRGDDGGDKSEPEDSKSPWTCTVTISWLGGAGGTASVNGGSNGGGGGGSDLVVVVATRWCG